MNLNVEVERIIRNNKAEFSLLTVAGKSGTAGTRTSPGLTSSP